MTTTTTRVAAIAQGRRKRTFRFLTTQQAERVTGLRTGQITMTGTENPDYTPKHRRS